MKKVKKTQLDQLRNMLNTAIIYYKERPNTHTIKDRTLEVGEIFFNFDRTGKLINIENRLN